MQEQLTVNQHYVPRFYMKPFATVIHEGTKKEKAFIAFYQFNTNVSRDDIPTTSICSEDYFYDEDGHVENELAKKENNWAYVIKKVNNGDKVTESDINIPQPLAAIKQKRIILFVVACAIMHLITVSTYHSIGN